MFFESGILIVSGQLIKEFQRRSIPEVPFMEFRKMYAYMVQSNDSDMRS